MDFTVSNISDRPEFLEAAADRMWRAWWRPKGFPFAQTCSSLRNTLKSSDCLPFGLVAHRGELFLGSALGIESDLDERPTYKPWVAALWTEPGHRGRGIASALTAHAAEALFSQGFEQIYLCSAASLRSFYLGLGWKPIEENVGADALIVYTRDSR
jgi:GNAT superfamily N-acetyltransferase